MDAIGEKKIDAYDILWHKNAYKNNNTYLMPWVPTKRTTESKILKIDKSITAKASKPSSSEKILITETIPEIAAKDILSVVLSVILIIMATAALSSLVKA